MSNLAKELKGERWYLLTTAATDEAARAGHGEVDIDHVLLALLVSGGASTRILSLAGLDLATARTALVDVQRRDLASLGVTTPVPPPSARHPYGAGTAALPWSDRARRAISGLPEGDHDARVLTAVLSDRESPARRLLEQAGVDADAVLAAAATTAPTDEERPDPSGGRRRWTAVITRTVAVPRADLWRVVSDPLRRPEWDDSAGAVRVLDERSFQTVDALAGALAGPGEPADDPGLVATHLVTDLEAGRLIEWEAHYPSCGHTEWLRVELEDDGSGSRLVLRHAFSRPRGLLRVWSGFYSWATRMQLKLLAQAIAQAASPG